MAEDVEPRRAKGTGWKFVHATLRDEILTLVLPPGAPLDETSLADRFNMSRSPVREALIRLEGEGLVVALPNRSTIVAPVDMQSFPKYVEALDIAQRMNTRLAAVFRTEQDLQAMAAAQQRFEAASRDGDHLAMSGTDKDFHMTIALAGRNPFLAGFYERLLDHGRRMLHLHFGYLERTRDGRLPTDGHAGILDAIRNRDADRADQLAHRHTQQFRDSFLAYLTETHAASFALTA